MKRMFLLSFILVSTSLLAQQNRKAERGNARDKIKAQRTAFINERLALSPEESKAFWPVYNRFTQELESLKKAQNSARKSAIEKLAFISDLDAEKYLNEELQVQQKMLDLQAKYQQELKKTIPVKKVVMLYKAEKDFKLELLRKIGKKGGPPQPDSEE